MDPGFIHNGPPPIYSVSQFPLLSFFAFSNNCIIFHSSILYSIVSAWPIHFKSKNFINLTISYLRNFLIYFNVVPNSKPFIISLGHLSYTSFPFKNTKCLELSNTPLSMSKVLLHICYIWPNKCVLKSKFGLLGFSFDFSICQIKKVPLLAINLFCISFESLNI